MPSVPGIMMSTVTIGKKIVLTYSKHIVSSPYSWYIQNLYSCIFNEWFIDLGREPNLNKSILGGRVIAQNINLCFFWVFTPLFYSLLVCLGLFLPPQPTRKWKKDKKKCMSKYKSEVTQEHWYMWRYVTDNQRLVRQRQWGSGILPRKEE